MRFEIRTPTRVLSTLVVLFVLVLGASLDVMAHQRGRGRSHNRGRHLGWERGRRVGQHRRDDNDRRRWRRLARRDRRDDRRTLRRNRRFERRSSWDDNRDWRGSRFGRTDFRSARFTRFNGGRGRR
jgi:hypothetical protein